MDEQKLMRLLNEEEGFKLDFKYTLQVITEGAKKELAKDVIAIANTEGGRGYILFGIEDKTKAIVGIENVPNNAEERIQQILSSRIMPPVPIQFEQVKLQDKIVGVLTIFQSNNIPHQMIQNGVFYLRRGSTTDVANRNEIAKMLQYSGLLSFEKVPCFKAALEELDFELMEAKLPYIPKETGNNIYLLEALDIVAEKVKGKGYCPTYGGLLLFGRRPQLFMPQTGIELSIQGERTHLQGNILQLLNCFEAQITPLVDKSYPLNALYEVVANAMIHRDYWNSNQSTYVEITHEYILVENPTCYYDEKGMRSPTRNNGWLYARLLLLQARDEHLYFGMGLKKVKTMFKGDDKISITYKQETGRFCVVLPGMDYREES